MSAYAKLQDKFARIADIHGAMAMLTWDSYVMMPPGSVEIRSRQMATLAAIAHDALIDAALPELAAEAENEPLEGWRRTNLILMQREIGEAAALPGDLVAALSKVAMESKVAWHEARTKNDYKLVLPHFGSLLGLVREATLARGEHFGLLPYDAALDTYQPGLRYDYFAPIFADLAEFLPGFAQTVIDRQRALPPIGAVPGHVALDVQKTLCEALLIQAGFDLSQGRLDVSPHPFCGGVPGDIRLTTRYAEDNFLESLTSTLHESGHALYNMNLPAAWRGQPVGSQAGIMVHESQSLIMEKQAGHTREFAGFLAGEIGRATHTECKPGTLYRHMTRIERTLIRTEADEITYPLHVVLRTRLEQALLSGDLTPGDLPVAWNEGMQNLLGIMPPDDAHGCLQDPHWYAGMIGYFPTYTLGAMLAAQLFAAAIAADPTIYESLGQGSFAPLQAWLKTNIHEKGSSLTAPDLIVAATGKPLDPAVFKAHLHRRYLDS